MLYPDVHELSAEQAQAIRLNWTTTYFATPAPLKDEGSSSISSEEASHGNYDRE